MFDGSSRQLWAPLGSPIDRDSYISIFNIFLCNIQKARQNISLRGPAPVQTKLFGSKCQHARQSKTDHLTKIHSPKNRYHFDDRKLEAQSFDHLDAIYFSLKYAFTKVYFRILFKKLNHYDLYLHNNSNKKLAWCHSIIL